MIHKNSVMIGVARPGRRCQLVVNNFSMLPTIIGMAHDLGWLIFSMSFHAGGTPEANMTMNGDIPCYVLELKHPDDVGVDIRVNLGRDVK